MLRKLEKSNSWLLRATMILSTVCARKILVALTLGCVSCVASAYACWLGRWLQEQAVVASLKKGFPALLGQSSQQPIDERELVAHFTLPKSPTSEINNVNYKNVPYEIVRRSGFGWHDALVWSLPGRVIDDQSYCSDADSSGIGGVVDVDDACILLDPPVGRVGMTEMPQWTLLQKYGWPVPFMSGLRCSMRDVAGDGQQFVSIYGIDLSLLLGWCGVTTVVPTRIHVRQAMFVICVHCVLWLVIISVVAWCRRSFVSRRLALGVCPSCGYERQMNDCAECGCARHQSAR